MARSLFALLVGINDYAPGIGRLSGCLNDVDHVRDYLQSSVDRDVLALEMLKDADATRDNIVRQFRTHLGRATAEDTVLFHYCGHGARWASAPEFLPWFPEGKDEGLVCIDSRSDATHFDLADKELAILIDEVSRTGAHVAIVLDCCHSGSGTRDVDSFAQLTARQTHEVATPRPLESYLDGYYAKQQREGRPLEIPRGRHVLLAACDRTERAMELPDRSGAFTSAVLSSLATTGPSVSYSDLFVRCRALIRRQVQRQTPQFEAYQHFNARTGFLGRAAAEAARPFRVYFDQGNWTIDAGALKGVATDEAMGVQVYRQDGTVAGTATISEVALDKSTLQLGFNADVAEHFGGELTGFGAAPLPILFAGDAAARALLQAALDRDQSIGVALTDVAEAARYRVVATADPWWFEAVDGTASSRIRGMRAPSAADAVPAAFTEALKSVARWERARTLQNPRTRLDTSQVDLTIDAGGQSLPAPEVTLSCSKGPSGWSPVRVAIKARNRTGRPLNLVLAHFSREYGIDPVYTGRLEPGEAWLTLFGGNEEDAFFITDERRTEETEELALFVSTQAVDAFALQQPDLELGLLDPAHRGFSRHDAIKAAQPENDWFSIPLRVRIVGQVAEVGRDEAVVAGGAIRIKPNPAVTAQVGLVAASEPARGLDDGRDFHRALASQGLELLNFSGSRGEAQNVLEISDIQGAGSLGEHPLEIEVGVPLPADQAILPVVFDGTHAMLAGEVHKDEAGHTRITIDRLPEVPSAQRSLGGSLKLYFFKTYLKQHNVNMLRWVEYGEGDAVTYHATGVADRVAAARNILLLVHGITGDTEGMAAGVRSCSLDRTFDLVLAYDYENLSTPIDETARLLKGSLAAVGLTAGDDKRLTLLVHSMGGLVSRWFIEREGGNALVDHLVMCGTPNGGSPFGRVDAARTILTTLTTLAMNYLPVAIPYAGSALLLVNRSKQLTPTLEQMNPSSEFISLLNQSPDPGVRYTILAGDVHEYRDPADPAFDQLLTKLAQGSLGDLLFASEPHDIAVGVESILGVRPGTPGGPARRHVACHHLNYFASSVGRAALAGVEW